MTDLTLLSREESERLLAAYMSKAESHSFGVISDGTPAFMLKNPKTIMVNPDKSVTWTTREHGLGLHSFIELVTGEKKQKTIYISLCLVNPASRENLKPLLAATVDPFDGRFNSKEAEIYILASFGLCFKIQVKLANLTLQYVLLQLMPSDFALKFRSVHCPFCREVT